MAQRVSNIIQHSRLIAVLPSVVLLGLGLFTFARIFLDVHSQ